MVGDLPNNPALSEIERSFMGPEAATQHRQALWLSTHHMLDDPETPYQIITDEDWTQRGSETFTLFFSIRQQALLSRFVMKACVASPPLTERVASWLNNRLLLENEGVQVPFLHAVDRATYIEEYIPFSLREAYDTASNKTQASIRDQFRELHVTSRRLGFHPISFHDVRSRGDDVVMIDFGSDLGGVFSTPSTLSENAVIETADNELSTITRRAI